MIALFSHTVVLGKVEGMKIKASVRFAMARGFLQFLMSECIAKGQVEVGYRPRLQ